MQFNIMNNHYIKDQIQPTDINLDSFGSEITLMTAKSVKDEPLRKRRFRDWYFLVLQCISIVCLIPLINYCMKYGALERLTRGYDSCRNICGQQNVMQDELKKSWCDGLDMRYRPYLLVFRPDGRNDYNATRLNQRHNDVVVPITLRDNVQRVCLVNCSVYQHYYQYKNRCILEKTKSVADIFWGKSGLPNFFLEVAEDVISYWLELLYFAVISLVLSAVLTILLYFATGFTIWLILIGLLIVSLINTIYMWVMWINWKQFINNRNYLFSELEKKRCETYLAFAIVGIFITISTFTVTQILRCHIRSVIKLFKVTWKPISAIRLLFFQPMVTSFSIGIATVTWFYLFLWIESSGHDVELYDDFYEYQKDPLIYFTRWYNFFIAFWLIEYMISCQHMIVAGAVSVWFFAIDKNILSTPIFYGLYNLLRYYLGSVSQGSLLILLAQTIKQCLGIIKRLLKNRVLIFDNHLQKSFIRLLKIDSFLASISRNAYIEIALYGESYYIAGENAYKSLSGFDIENIETTGKFVLLLGKLLIGLIAVVLSTPFFQEKEDIQHAWVLILFSGCFAYLLSYCFLSIYEMTTNTVFLCFCEDYKYNNGTTKPYFTPQELVQLVMDFKRNNQKENYVEYARKD